MPDFKMDLTVNGVPVSLLGHTHDHGTLTGLTDDDHTQYARLLGRYGGQILIGGTANNNVLTLQGNSGTANTATNKAISLLVGNSGATEALTVLNNGRVGIGTTSPAVALDVVGSITASGVITGNGSGLTTLNASNISSGTLADARFTNALLRDGSRTLTADWDIGDNRRVLADGVRARDGAGLRLEDDAGNLGVFVEDGGDVGIGTATPNKKLHIYESNLSVGGFAVQNIASGQNAQTQNLLINDANYYAYYGITSTGFTGATILNGGKAFFGSYLTDTVIFTQTAKDIIFATNLSEVARITSGGNVGIGTTSPDFKLYVLDNQPSDVAGLYVENSAVSGVAANRRVAIGVGGPSVSVANWVNSAFFESQASDGFFLGSFYSSIRFGAGSGRSTQMILTTSGNVGIGTTSPGARLEVDQASATANIPTLHLRQADDSEEFIRFEATVGAGNAIDTAALGTYYGKIRVHVEGVGDKFIALYNT